MGVSQSAQPHPKAWRSLVVSLCRTTFLGLEAALVNNSVELCCYQMQGEAWMKSSCAEKVKWASLLLLVAVLRGGSAQTVEVCDLSNIIEPRKSVYLSFSAYSYH